MMPFQMTQRLARTLHGLTLALTLLTLLPSHPSQAAETPRRGGVLTAIVQPEPPNLTVALQQSSPTQLVASKIYESLLTYSFDLKPLPSLARSWEVSPDGLTYTFHLQRGVTWHDGRPFSADDVVFSYQKVLAGNARTRGLMANVATLEAPDANTVVFRLKAPYAAFLYAFDLGGGAIYPRHLYDTDVPLAQNPNNATPIGTGPFKFKRWERGAYIELVRNEHYWQAGKPYLDGITYRVIPDAASRRLALEQGTVQQAVGQDIEPADLARVAALPHIASTRKGYEYWSSMHFLELNAQRKPFDDKRFRQALAHAINREFITEKIMFGTGVVPTGPIHRNTRYYDPDVRRYAYDPKRAIALLDEIGLKPDANGVRITIGFIPSPFGELQRRIAEVIRQNLSQVGIKVEIENLDLGGVISRVSNWDYDVHANGVFQYGDPAIGVARTYLGSNIRKGVMYSNTSHYNNPEVDALFEEAARSNDEARRQALYSRIQKILVEDVPVLWLAETSYTTLLDRRVRDAIVTGLGANGTYGDAWLAEP